MCENTDPITDYTATISYTVAGLESCSSYYFTVRPDTRSGLPLGDPVGMPIDTANGTPGTPENFVVTPYNGTCLNLNWDVPSSNADCVTGYSTSCREMSKAWMKKPVVTSDRSQFYCGLKPCTTYQCEVIALASGGANDSPPATAQAVTLEAARKCYSRG